MGGHVAFPGSPLCCRLRENEAELAGRKFFCLLASIACINDGVAAAAIELASVLAHEKALDTLLYACTNHGNHILSLWFSRRVSLAQRLKKVNPKNKPVFIPVKWPGS
jgi:hypothetical protein